jgi:hypothetical protein
MDGYANETGFPELIEIEVTAFSVESIYPL